ncbi:H-NS histone family protein [uncultured Ruegeria sp.]|uniref:H-NS histone family protein n=1 Tax=uncultured Ruegeria sp. TaxID=259304 RepID=UPI0026018713|nr:H-NS histone family protein [uncultured Ruegeria sp.]
MSIDISGLSAAELKELAAKIEKRAVEVEKEALRAALTKMRAIADKLGVAFEDVIALHGGKGKKTATKTAPKYANPDDPSQTWTGRGRKPAWVKEALEAGKSIDDLAI